MYSEYLIYFHSLKSIYPKLFLLCFSLDIQKSCPRPKDWCNIVDQTFLMLDCDGDDIPDPVCSDINEQFGVIQSSAECVDSWPNGECL